MTIATYCFDDCGNIAIPAPPYPPSWGGGSGATPPTTMQITCPLVPVRAPAGGPDVPVQVNGRNFTAATQILVNGAPVATTFVSSTRVDFVARASVETVARAITIGAQDGGVASAVTCPFNFTRVTVLTAGPNWMGFNGAALQTLTVNGTDFTPASVVVIENNAVPTTYVSPTQLTASIDVNLHGVGFLDVVVRNGAVASNAGNLTIVWNPELTMLVPSTLPAGGAPVQVQLLGQFFGNNTKVLVDNVEVATTWVSGGDVRFMASRAAAGTQQITVRLGDDPTDNIRPVAAPLTLPLTFT